MSVAADDSPQAAVFPLIAVAMAVVRQLSET